MYKYNASPPSPSLHLSPAGFEAITRLRTPPSRHYGVLSHTACTPSLSFLLRLILEQLLQLLPLMSPPTALVEALPHFVGEDPTDMSNVVKEYKELLEGDRSMLVHVIG